MVNSKNKSLLIEVYLTNGSGYNNSAYGIVDGVMYLTTGQLDYSYNSNTYKSGLVYNYSDFINSIDVLETIGGYSLYNEFQFEIVDEGITDLLLAEGINFYRSQ